MVETFLEQPAVDFLCDTQPLGNMRFLDNMIQTGTTFMTTLYIWRYPGETEGLWQAFLHNIPNSFVITDISHQESGEALQKLKRAIREQYSRWADEKEAYDKEIAKEEYQDLNYLAKVLRKSVEVMKYMCTRIVLYADTKQDLEKRSVEVRKQLEKEQFGAAVLVMEQEYEYQAFFLNHTAQMELPNQRIGRDVPSAQVMTTFPANHVYMDDARGQHLGYSMTGGNIILDFFELDGLFRKHYNAIIIGEMGSGKSTLIKKILLNLGARGYLLRGFDKSGEYRQIIQHLGGHYISLDGSDGTINIFQVFPTAVDPETQEVDEETSFIQHKSKLSAWYAVLKPTAPPEELDIFDLMLDELYQTFDMSIQDAMHFTTFEPAAYPILSDFISVLENRLNSPDNSILESRSIERILLTMRKLKQAYGQLFDGYTSIGDIQTAQILFFNIDGLMALDNKPIIDAQMFNALNLLWATLVNHGKEQVNLYKQKQVDFDFLLRSLLVIDECHNLINKDNLSVVKFVNTIQREGRKLFIGTLLATQSISSLAPEVLSSEEAELLRDIYNFSQYKIFFKVASANIPHLKQLTTHDITDNQVQRIARYPQGRCLLNITGGTSIEFDVDASKRELALFDGGGRYD